jgi:hypothetical protein
LRLPDDKGFVELVNEPAVTDRRNPQPTSLVAYFLQPDARSAMTPSPTDVGMQIDPGRGSRKRTEATALPLGAEPKADDPAGGSRFASKVGPYALSGIRGTLKAKVGGQDVSVDYLGGR